MALYRIRMFQEDFDITSEELRANPRFDTIVISRGGPGGTLLEERIFIDWMMRNRLDSFQALDRSKTVPFEWKLNGPIVNSHVGTGAWVAPNIFRDTVDSPFTAASNPVGKAIHVPGGQGAGKNAGRMRNAIIESRINNSRVTIEGVIPFPVTNLNYSYRQMGPNVEAVAIILNSADPPPRT